MLLCRRFRLPTDFSMHPDFRHNLGMLDCDQQLYRVRRICATLPETTERLSHGEPTFFVRKKVYAMFAGNHHNDGHIAVWIPAPPGLQARLIQAWPRTFFKPPYVGVRGWVGIELDSISDQDLLSHLCEATCGFLRTRDSALLIHLLDARRTLEIASSPAIARSRLHLPFPTTDGSSPATFMRNGPPSPAVTSAGRRRKKDRPAADIPRSKLWTP
jgi:hypothetical protein